MDTNSELWRDVAGYEGRYQVSNRGRVRSLGVLMNPWIDNGYRRVYLRSSGSRKAFKVSRLVASAFLGLSDDQIVDHVDRNRSNDNVTNIRVCGYSQNKCNCAVRADSASRVKGVQLHPIKPRQRRASAFRVRIQVNGKRLHLGYFDTVEAASSAYRTAALKYHGEFAHF